MWKESLEACSFYDFDYTLMRLGYEPLTKLDRNGRWVDVPVQLDDERHVVRVQARGTIAEPLFDVSSDSQDRRNPLINHIKTLFKLDNNLEKVHQHFLSTNLEQLFLAHPGTPIVKDFHLYDCLMKVIIHQQLNMKFAQTLTTRFVRQFGEEVDGVWFYPAPEKVAGLSYDQLRELQFSQRKAEYVIDTSRKIVNKEIDLEALAKQSDGEVLETLVKIRGIGPWTAENWLMFGAGRENLFPKADIGIQNALKFYFNMEKKPSKEEMEEMSRFWGPYKSYASLTLWRSIEGES